MSLDIVLAEHLKKAVGFPQLDVTATIILGGLSFEALSVTALTRRERYVDDMFEDSVITVATTPSQFTELIQYGHENIVLSVNRRPISGGNIVSNRYRAVLVENRDSKLEGNIADVDTVAAGDNSSFSLVTFQLIPFSAYDLRLREVGGTFRDETPFGAMRYFLSKMLLKDDYNRSEFVGKIETDTGLNSTRYRAIQVKEGLPLLALPDYLHERFGFSNEGVGCFLKRQTWYLFKPYTMSKYQEDVPKLTVINAPPSRYSQLERNYTQIGNTLTLAATGETRHVKHSDAQALNAGVGLRFASLDTLMPREGSTKPKNVPKDYMTSVRNRDYGNEFNRVATDKNRVTDNIGRTMSMLALQSGEIVETVWENGTIDFLVPGMATKFIYAKNGKVETMHGTLISAEELVSIPHGGMVDRRYQSNVKLTLFLKRD